VSETRWGIDEHDVANQGSISYDLEIVDGRVERFSAPYRYPSPAQLDLLAELAGMKLRECSGGWKRSRSRATSTCRCGEPEV
jgi:hypothetical protein